MSWKITFSDNLKGFLLYFPANSTTVWAPWDTRPSFSPWAPVLIFYFEKLSVTVKLWEQRVDTPQVVHRLLTSPRADRTPEVPACCSAVGWNQVWGGPAPGPVKRAVSKYNSAYCESTGKDTNKTHREQRSASERGWQIIYLCLFTPSSAPPHLHQTHGPALVCGVTDAFKHACVQSARLPASLSVLKKCQEIISFYFKNTESSTGCLVSAANCKNTVTKIN